jgi:hypothetical protein
MQLIDFSAAGWESWDLARRLLIRERMPVLVDDDLLFEDSPGSPRPTVLVNEDHSAERSDSFRNYR